MKTISAGLQAHLDQDTTTLATCWKVTRRDGTVLGFTDHDRPLTLNADGLGNVIYEAASGYNRGALDTQLGLAVDNLSLEGLLDSDAISEDDLAYGRYDGAEVKMFQVNWVTVAQGPLKLLRGIAGTITLHRTTYVAELHDLSHFYGQPIGELYSLDCRVATLGDSRCQVDLAPADWQATTVYAVGDRVMATGAALPFRHFRCTQAGTSGGSEPSWPTTVGDTVSDGSVGWTTHLAFTLDVEVDTVVAPLAGEPGAHTFTTVEDLSDFVAIPDGTEPWFFNGSALWLTGDNTDLLSEIKAFDPTTSTLTLYLAPPTALAIGDTCTLTVGCARTREICSGRFHNILNFRGEPYIPGLNEALDYPSPGGG